jgi:hypothetical protein
LIFHGLRKKIKNKIILLVQEVEPLNATSLTICADAQDDDNSLPEAMEVKKIRIIILLYCDRVIFVNIF